MLRIWRVRRFEVRPDKVPDAGTDACAADATAHAGTPDAADASTTDADTMPCATDIGFLQRTLQSQPRRHRLRFGGWAVLLLRPWYHEARPIWWQLQLQVR